MVKQKPFFESQGSWSLADGLCKTYCDNKLFRYLLINVHLKEEANFYKL